MGTTSVSHSQGLEQLVLGAGFGAATTSISLCPSGQSLRPRMRWQGCPHAATEAPTPHPIPALSPKEGTTTQVCPSHLHQRVATIPGPGSIP